MHRVIDHRELRNQNAHVLDAVEAGARFVVTRNGAPVAELRPITRGRRRFVAKADLLRVIAGGPRIDATAFRRDLESAVEQHLLDT